MKKINIVFLLAISLNLSCASVNYWKIKVELPGVSAVKLDEFKELVITNFLVEKETKDFNLSQELVDYLSPELGKHYKGKIISKEISIEKKEIFKEKDFWKNLLTESKEALFLTGTAQYTQEVRKAILEKYSERPEDFISSEKGLAQRKFFTLVIQFYLINAQTGEIIYERNFKEARGYQNPKQTANFAFFDLIQKTNVKFLRNVFGLKKIQQRYLISD